MCTPAKGAKGTGRNLGGGGREEGGTAERAKRQGSIAGSSFKDAVPCQSTEREKLEDSRNMHANTSISR